MSWWQALLDPNTQWVLAGCILLGISSGVLGCFAFLRGRSLMGDALAHAALPGVCLVFLLTGSKSVGLFLLGAGLSGLVATYFISMISRHSRIKEDTALALILSVFFGIGIVLLTYIQHSSSGNQSGLDKFLFGQAASLVGNDVNTMVVVGAILILLTSLLFKEFKLLSFDAGFGRGLGLPMGMLDGLLMVMLLMSVVIGLQAVGVVLMAAMLITPAVTARYWTNKLGSMVILSGVFGALSGAFGTLLSTQVQNLPTGPIIVLGATALFLFSLIFSPSRGVLFKLIRFLRLRNQVLQQDVLRSLYECMEYEIKQQRISHNLYIPVERLSQKSGKAHAAVVKALSSLQKKGWVAFDKSRPEHWTFTKTGVEKAHDLILNQRLWDLFLMNEQKYQGYGVDQNEELIIHQLTKPQLKQMLVELEHYDMTPFLLGHMSPPTSRKKSEQGGVPV
ncbi:manganese ABC transporter permease [Brevibacillus sp. SKDU10]|uniref:metal ABC transporter permease n=1 Tax=Brevibacillus sp. SKDU10 TaxID=1247872 RepID=UPI0007C93E23|nr:metal ABC transporter permease [Brevibacillus sp. SKDU10]OAJ73579.1 manganese ABC transporter permease [Brevibacillus sp. SKDU10]